jgi:hypothetical protein
MQFIGLLEPYSPDGFLNGWKHWNTIWVAYTISNVMSNGWLKIYVMLCSTLKEMSLVSCLYLCHLHFSQKAWRVLGYTSSTVWFSTSNVFLEIKLCGCLKFAMLHAQQYALAHTNWHLNTLFLRIFCCIPTLEASNIFSKKHQTYVPTQPQLVYIPSSTLHNRSILFDKKISNIKAPRY